MMKLWVSCAFFLLLTFTVSAQQGTVQMQCHDLASTNNYVGPDEVIVNGMACRMIKQSPAVSNASPPIASAVASVAPTDRQAVSDPAPATTPDPRSASDVLKEPVPPASTPGRIASGSRIVIAPMGGFETYFAAAIREKGVPVTLTLERSSAQYFVVSTETEWQGFVYGSGGNANWNQNGGSATHAAAASSTRGLEASIMLIDARSKDVVWAYEVHKSSHGALLFGTHAARGQQSLAEACAKHLKEFIEKQK
jgi:hypothetical protein